MPLQLYGAIAGMWADTAGTWAERERFVTLRMNNSSIKRLKLEWKRRPWPAAQPSSPESRQLAERIGRLTREENRNNVTRTAAYLRMYLKHRELHWAFLAHMVSRNGGWNMTDLQGELLPRLLSPEIRGRLFNMLEDSNSFIFGDAYPQLLLYEESVRLGRPMFHLLPALGVSSFMRPVWERFWETRDSVMLSIALIINEQHYIESRIVKDPYIAEHVLGSLSFQAQSALQLNQVMFPYGGSGTLEGANGRQRIAGLVLENFGNLRERIDFGKKLYGILFGIPAVAEGAPAFAEKTAHTGSRADYWPELFASVRSAPSDAAYKERLDGVKLRPGAARLYSPQLADAWKDKPLRAPERYDWFHGGDSRAVCAAAAYFTDVRPTFPYELSAEICFGLNKLELAVLAKEALS